MDIAGQFFLCMPPSRCTTSDGMEGVLLPVREPAPSANFPNGLVAVWAGEEAVAFEREHAGELRPGRGLRLALHRVVARGDQVRARVLQCQLLPLPPSWQRAQQQTNPA